MRSVIIHYHIFKNAGSSIDRLLQNNFGTGWSTFEGKTPTSLLTVRDIEDYLGAHPELQAISSHLGRPPLPSNVESFPMIFLRHPLDRAASVYSHERRAPSNVESAEIAKLRDLAGYVKWCLDPSEGRMKGGVVIRNYQVVHLSKASFRRQHIYQAEALKTDLDDVLGFLDRLPFFGIVEEFEASLQLLKRKLPPLWSDFQVANLQENISPGREATLQARLEKIERELGPDVLRPFLLENQLDMELYETALAKFRGRVAAELPEQAEICGQQPHTRRE